MPQTTLKELPFARALAEVEEHGAAFVDIRPVDAYLEVHIPGSLNLEYDSGPGFQGRARDCIPLDTPLVLVDLGSNDPRAAADGLKSKGFTVLGSCADAINKWAEARGTPASTETETSLNPPPGCTVLDVGDAGATVPAGTLLIPVDRLWSRAGEIPDGRIAVAAGYALRASLALGILERHRSGDVIMWRTRRRP
jgi:rhodanese-related sulfurtransferase